MSARGTGLALAAVASILASACAKESTDFTAGVAPWEVPSDAPGEWPDVPSVPGEVALVTGSRIGSGTTPSYAWAHGRVLLAASVADVWAAVQWRPGVLVAVYPDTPTVDCQPVDRPEPGYELSYGVKEIPNDFGELGRSNWFQVDWRGATTRDAGGAVRGVNIKAQKVEGTAYVALMRESIVATPAAGGGTVLEIVRHINAPDETPASAGEWIQLWVSALEAQVAGAPLLPAGYCFP